MARKLFEKQGIRRRNGQLASGVTYVVYTDVAGTVLADISATSGGTAIAGSEITTADIDGLGPAAFRFYGPPSGQDTLYLRCPADTRLGVQELEADEDERLDALEAGGGGGGGIAATVFDAKGDLLAASAADTAARLAVGTTGSGLVVDPSATTGLKWVGPRDINVTFPPYNATGDGTTDDATAIQAALNAAKDQASNTWYGGKVYMPAGMYVIGTALTVPPGVELVGAGETATILLAKASTSFAYLIRNEVNTGSGQEYWWLRHFSIFGNKANSAVVTTGILCEGGGYVDSGIENVGVFDCSGHGIQVKSNATTMMGPYFIENVWVARNGGQQIIIQGSVQQVWGRRITIERPPTGNYGIYVDGTPGASGEASTGHSFRDIHCEMNDASTYGILLNNVTGVEVDGLAMNGSTSGTQGGVHITGSGTDNFYGATHIVLKNIMPGGFTNAIKDDVRGKTIPGGKAVSLYVTTGAYIDTLLEDGTANHRVVEFLANNTARYALQFNGTEIVFYNVAGGVELWRGRTDGSTRFLGNLVQDIGSGISPTGTGIVALANASAVPSAGMTGGGIVYVEAGALKYRGSGGTITTLAPA